MTAIEELKALMVLGEKATSSKFKVELGTIFIGGSHPNRHALAYKPSSCYQDEWKDNANFITASANFRPHMQEIIERYEKMEEALGFISSMKRVETMLADIKSMEGSFCPDFETTLKAMYLVAQNKAQQALEPTKGEG